MLVGGWAVAPRLIGHYAPQLIPWIRSVLRPLQDHFDYISASLTCELDGLCIFLRGKAMAHKLGERQFTRGSYGYGFRPSSCTRVAADQLDLPMQEQVPRKIGSLTRVISN